MTKKDTKEVKSTNAVVKAKSTTKKIQPKNLTVTELNKLDKKLDRKVSFTINIGGTNYKLSYDEVFRKTKQHRVIEDVVNFFQESNNNIELLELVTPYTALLIIKHFTSLDVSDDIDEALALLNVLVDLEVLDVLINELPEEEVTKIYELLKTTLDRMNENLAESELEAEALSKEIQNKEVKELINDGLIQ